MAELAYHIDAPLPGFAVYKTGVAWIKGWAFEAGSGGLPVRAYALVDGIRRGRVDLGGERADVARHFGRPEASRAGFTCMLHSAQIAEGGHHIQIAFEFDTGEPLFTAPLAFAVFSPFAYTWSPVPRIVLVGAPKTGGTYQESVLLKYLGIADNPAYNGEWRWEPMLNEGRIPEVGPQRPYITGGHLMPRELNLALMRAHRLAPAAGWRNIADALISVDDHFHAETHVWPQVYIGDRERYVALSDQQRYRFLIRHVAPWYVDYYLAWREAGVPIFARYEWMATDAPAFFAHFIECLTGELDSARLREVLGAPIPGTRFNKGINGRGSAFDECTRALLEDLLREHYTGLDELIEELPWRGGSAAAVAMALAARAAELRTCERLRPQGAALQP